MEDYKLVLGDFVMGILAYGPNKEEKWNVNKVYEAFFKLSEKHKELFEGAYFSVRNSPDGSKRYYSKKFEDTFFALGTGNLLNRMGIAQDVFFISKKAKEVIRRGFIKQSKEEEIKKLESLAMEFREIINPLQS